MGPYAGVSISNGVLTIFPDNPGVGVCLLNYNSGVPVCPGVSCTGTSAGVSARVDGGVLGVPTGHLGVPVTAGVLGYHLGVSVATSVPGYRPGVPACFTVVSFTKHFSTNSSYKQRLTTRGCCLRGAATSCAHLLTVTAPVQVSCCPHYTVCLVISFILEPSN